MAQREGAMLWLGVALTALMRIPPAQRMALGVEAWRRLVQCPENEYRRYLLCECVDAYLPLDDAQRRDFEMLVRSDPDAGVRAMATTLFEKIRQEGVLQERREFVQMLLAERFGPLSPRVQEQVQTMAAERLTALGRALLKAQSLQALGLEE